MYRSISILTIFAITSVAAAQDSALRNSRENGGTEAVAVIEKAIKAMGGDDVWKRAGGATATVVITREHQPAQTVNWTDDWSKPRVRFRRDSAAGEKGIRSLIGSDEAQVNLGAGGKSTAAQHDNGIAVLAMGYPASALSLSLSHYGCSFDLGKKPNLRLPIAKDDPDKITVSERCPDPFYPQGEVTLVWVFRKSTAMPESVEIPVWDHTHHIVHAQVVTFVAFDAIQGKLVPSQLKIQRFFGSVDEITISNTNFSEILLDEKFAWRKP